MVQLTRGSRICGFDSSLRHLKSLGLQVFRHFKSEMHRDGFHSSMGVDIRRVIFITWAFFHKEICEQHYSGTLRQRQHSVHVHVLGRLQFQKGRNQIFKKTYYRRPGFSKYCSKTLEPELIRRESSEPPKVDASDCSSNRPPSVVS